MDTMTPRQRDVDERLRAAASRSLEDWIAQQRNRRLSWDAISLSLHRLTGDAVNGETLRRWYGDRAEAGDAA